MRILLLIATLAACAAPPTHADPAGIGAIVGSRAAGAAQQCVPVLSTRNALQAIDGRTLFYRAGGTVWINRLAEDCSRMGPHSNLAVRMVGNRYCEGDPLYVLEGGSNQPVAVCALGRFTPYR